MTEIILNAIDSLLPALEIGLSIGIAVASIILVVGAACALVYRLFGRPE